MIRHWSQFPTFSETQSILTLEETRFKQHHILLVPSHSKNSSSPNILHIEGNKTNRHTNCWNECRQQPHRARQIIHSTTSCNPIVWQQHPNHMVGSSFLRQSTSKGATRPNSYNQQPHGLLGPTSS